MGYGAAFDLEALPSSGRELSSDALLPSGGSTPARVREQISWYSHDAGRIYRALRGSHLVELLLAAAIPVLMTAYVTGFLVVPAVLVSLLASINVVALGAQHILFDPERAARHRLIAEHLSRELNLYLSNAYPYDHPEKEQALASRAAEIEAVEESWWQHIGGDKVPTMNRRDEKQSSFDARLEVLERRSAILRQRYGLVQLSQLVAAAALSLSTTLLGRYQDGVSVVIALSGLLLLLVLLKIVVFGPERIALPKKLWFIALDRTRL